MTLQLLIERYDMPVGTGPEPWVYEPGWKPWEAPRNCWRVHRVGCSRYLTVDTRADAEVICALLNQTTERQHHAALKGETV